MWGGGHAKRQIVRVWHTEPLCKANQNGSSINNMSACGGLPLLLPSSVII